MKRAISFIFTICNMIGGMVAIVFSAQHYFLLAGYAIIFAGFFDAMDGLVARMAETQSPLGVEMDSFADFTSFGIAPAFLISNRLQPIWTYLILFLFVIAGAIRLAKFNIKSHRIPQTYKSSFQGLPITIAGLFVASFFLVAQRYFPRVDISVPLMIILIALSGLMVSRIRYRKLEKLVADFTPRFSTAFSVFLMLPAVVIIILYGMVTFLFVLLTLYILYELTKAIGEKLWVGNTG